MKRIARNIKGSITEIALGKIDDKLDGREITRPLKEPLDQQFGILSSKRIRHDRLWNFVRELAEGLFDDDMPELRLKLMVWANRIKRDSNREA